MALTCPDGIVLYRPLNPGGDITVTQADLGITDSNNLNFFFENESTAAAIVELIDDASGTTVWSTTSAPDPQRNGSITNTGRTITYTQGLNAEQGDCITIKYYADNQQGTADDECDQTFLICLGDRPNTEDCVDNIVKLNADNIILTASDFGISSDCNVILLSAAGLTVLDGNLALNGEIVLANINGVESSEITYRITCPGSENIECTASLILQTENNFQCTNRSQWSFTTLPANISIAELGANANGPVSLESLTVTFNGSPFLSTTTFNSQITFPSGTANGTYQISYTINDGTNSASCTKNVVINTSGIIDNGGNNGGSAIGVGCQNSSWTNGQPSMQCGDGPQRFQVTLRDENGNAIDRPVSSIAFGLIGVPSGGSVTPISNDGNGVYTIEIDLSQVNCAGSIDASVGYSL